MLMIRTKLWSTEIAKVTSSYDPSLWSRILCGIIWLWLIQRMAPHSDSCKSLSETYLSNPTRMYQDYSTIWIERYCICTDNWEGPFMVTMKLFDFIRTSMFQLRYFALTILLDSVIGDPVHSEIAFDLRDCSDQYNKLTLIYKQNVIVLFIFTFATHVTDSG